MLIRRPAVHKLAHDETVRAREFGRFARQRAALEPESRRRLLGVGFLGVRLVLLLVLNRVVLEIVVLPDPKCNVCRNEPFRFRV